MSHKVSFALKLNMYGHFSDTPFEPFLKLAKHAEDVGFTGIYTVDHLYLPKRFLLGMSEGDADRPYFLEAWTAMAALAAVTKKVRIGPQVTPISLRHPVFIAKMAATIDLISKGRFVLQVGTGWHREEYENFGFPFDEKFSVRYQKMLEGIEVIKVLWTTEGLANYQGQYYQVKDAPFWPKPAQKPSPPIWFGGMGKKVRHAVARYGDGWTPALPHFAGMGSEAYRDGLREIRELARAAGRDPESILPAALFATVIDADRSRAIEKCRILTRREDWAHFTLEEMETHGMVIYGTPDDCARSIERYVEAGVRHFTFTFVPATDFEGALRGMELYATKVLPRFQ